MMYTLQQVQNLFYRGDIHHGIFVSNGMEIFVSRVAYYLCTPEPEPDDDDEVVREFNVRMLSYFCFVHSGRIFRTAWMVATEEAQRGLAAHPAGRQVLRRRT